MKYFLDFDGVIFDIESFKVKMNALGASQKKRNAQLFALMKEKDPSLDITQFVFPDALAFIQGHLGECTVVSSFVSSNPEFQQEAEEARMYQEKKIALSGITSLLGEEHVCVVGASKTEGLAELQALCVARGESCVFIDDRIEYLEEASKLGIPAIWMHRGSGVPNDRFPTAHSFDDIIALL